MIPFLELSKRIAQKGHTISFISTPRNINSLPQIPPHLSHLINFVPIPLPSGDGHLPDGVESTSLLPLHLVPHLKLAYDALEPEVDRFLDARRPDWIIYDFAPYWIPRIAAKSNVSTAYFSVISAAMWCFMGPPALSRRNSLEDFTYPPEWIPFPNNLAFRLHEAKRLMAPQMEAYPPPPPQLVPDYVRAATILAESQVYAVRSCPELESDMLDLATQLYGKRLIPVGLLIPDEPDPRFVGDETWNLILEWLNKQKKATVVYVAFGSETAITKDEVTELSLGLEASGSPFVWVLNQKYHHLLPEGYRSRIEDGFISRIESTGSGTICSSWVPQVKILSHESIGGILTHCGWSSVIESLHFGVPLIMLPLHVADQGLIARVFAEKEVGVEIPRKEEDGAFVRGDVAETVRKVVAEEEGRRFRDRAAEEKENVFGNRAIHDRCIDDFVQFLEDHRNKGIGREANQ
ncbi:Putative UDP-rhamnose:rhamnosyltransferase 1 [Linum perenne]